jgi:UDP-3-O-[3-hydroxymyristoyl] glucosamine N-acyltransferase
METITQRLSSESEGWNIPSILKKLKLGIEFIVEGNSDKMIKHVASLFEATDEDLSFCSSNPPKAAVDITRSSAGAILCAINLKGLLQTRNEPQIIYVNNPRRVFVSVVRELERRTGTGDLHGISSIAPTAIISGSAKLGKNCQIGNYVTIGEQCVIGNNCIIHDRVTIASFCTLGNNCVIQSGVTIGEDGFSYERHDDLRLEHFPHFKGVIIGDDVEISANVNIARGSLTDTVIGSGTKLDALVHLAHNVRVGRNCQLTGGTVIGGSAVLGDSCWTGLNSTLKDHAKLGDNVIVAAGACVIQDVPEGDIVAGVPAKSIKSKVTDPNIFLMAGQKRADTGRNTLDVNFDCNI